MQSCGGLLMAVLRYCRHSGGLMWQKRGYSSALYVTGQKASETYSVLTPFIDCDEKFKNIAALKDNIEARGMDIDVDKLKESWDFLKGVQETKYQLESRRQETTNKIKLLVQQKTEKSESEMKALKMLGKLIRENLKNISKEVWDLEESVILRVLALPNDLHPDTPLHDDKVVWEAGTSPGANKRAQSHLQHKGVSFLSPTCYYLHGRAAHLEILLMQFCADFLRREKFIQTSNCDFSKSLVIEGCGMKHTDPNSVLILQSSEQSTNENTKLHLVGGASLPAFCALFTKHETEISGKPVRLFSLGRRYSPLNTTEPPSLLNVAQESCVEMFIATEASAAATELNKVVRLVSGVYQDLGLHCRLVQVSAINLQSWESLRVSIQMFSTHLGSYVEVGHVSLSGSYICKRLLMRDTNGTFPSLVSGQVMSVPRVLACLMEQDPELSITLPRF